MAAELVPVRRLLASPPERVAAMAAVTRGEFDSLKAQADALLSETQRQDARVTEMNDALNRIHVNLGQATSAQNQGMQDFEGRVTRHVATTTVDLERIVEEAKQKFAELDKSTSDAMASLSQQSADIREVCKRATETAMQQEVNLKSVYDQAAR